MTRRTPRRLAPRFWGGLGALLIICQTVPALSADFDARLELGAYADTDHVSVLTPSIGGTLTGPSQELEATGDYIVDVVSAASVDIVSTASQHWTEVRQAADLSVEHKSGRAAVSVSGSVSREPDFLSWSVGAKARIELDERHVTLGGGYGFSHDSAGLTGTPLSVYSLDLDRNTFQGGVEFITGRSSRLNLLAEVALEAGHQEKPYRFLPLFTGENAARVREGESVENVNLWRLPGRVAEALPEDRQRLSLTIDWALRARASTLRVNERLYTDSWGLSSTTTDVRWIVDFSERWTFAPHARLHAQSGADFWRLAYIARLGGDQLELPSLRSGDRELGPLVTAALGLGAEYRLTLSPSGWTLGSVLEAHHTRFFKTLFIDQRTGLLLVLSVQRGF